MKKKMIFLLTLVMLVMIPFGNLTVFAYTEGIDGMGPQKISGGQRDFIWPVPGIYKMQSDFYDRRQHYALDFFAPVGTTIVASYPGTVIRAVDGGPTYSGDGFGNYVVIQHEYRKIDGSTVTLYSRYSHMNSVSISEGTPVSAGQAIGKVGTSGNVTGPHVDFQILYGNWEPYKTYSIDPYANDLLELPSGIIVTDDWDCGKEYLALVQEHYSHPLIKNYYFDLNGLLDGSTNGGLEQYGTADVYINGDLVASGQNDYWAPSVPVGTRYEIKNIHPNEGYSFDGTQSGNLSGTIEGNTSVVLAFSKNDYSSITEKPEEVDYKGHTYLLYNTPVTWFFAKDFCKSQGGYLVEIDDLEENAFVASMCADKERIWLGATDFGSEGNWHWESGREITLKTEGIPWGDSQPDNNNSNNDYENYAEMFPSTGKWNDIYGSFKSVFVCEFDTACEHSYKFLISKDPSENEEGKIIGTCEKCEKEKKVTLPKLSTEDYTYYVSDQPSCTEEGVAQWIWKNTEYGNYMFMEILPKTAHQYQAEFVPATCVEKSYTIYTCSCGDTYKEYSEDVYSEWSDKHPEGIPEDLMESRTEYRYSDYETKTSYDTSMSGWTQKGGEWKKSESGSVEYVSSWPSGFHTGHALFGQYANNPVPYRETTTSKTEIDSIDTIGYIYYHWCRGEYEYGPENRQTRKAQESGYGSFHAFFSTTDPNGLTASNDGDGSRIYANADCCRDTYWYYPITVMRETYTIYKKLFTYERWTDWSDWSAEEYIANDTRKVENRTVYRYAKNTNPGHQWDEGVVTNEPTYTSEGLKTYTCTVCHETKTEKIPVLEGVPGDVTGDGDVTIGDVVKINRHVIGKIKLTEAELLAADVTGDKDVTIADVVKVNRFVIGKITSLIPTSNGGALAGAEDSATSGTSKTETLAGDGAVVTIGDVHTVSGEDTLIPVTFSGNPGIAGLAFAFNLPEGLVLQNVIAGDILADGVFTVNENVVSWYTSDNIFTNGNLMNLLVSAEKPGSYPIVAELKNNAPSNLADENGDSVDVQFVAGNLSVEDKPEPIPSTLNVADVKLKASATKQQTVTLDVQYDGDGELTFESSSAKVTVDENGTFVIPKNIAGTMTITVKAPATENYQATEAKAVVTVARLTNSITASPVTKMALASTQSFMLSVTQKGKGKLTYKSSNASVKVASDGKVTIAKNFAGRATITVKAAAAGAYKAATKDVVITIKPAPVTVGTAKNVTGQKIALSWKKAAGAGGYQIQYSTSKNFKSNTKSVTVKSAATVKGNLTKLTKGKTYYIRIRAYRKDAAGNLFSGWTSFKAIKVTK